MPYVGLVHNRSNIIDGTSGVAFPVPRNKAVIGRATVFENSSEKKNNLNKILRGTNAKKISNHLMNFNTKTSRLISD